MDGQRATNRAQRKVLSCFLSVVNTYAIQTAGGLSFARARKKHTSRGWNMSPEPPQSRLTDMSIPASPQAEANVRHAKQHIMAENVPKHGVYFYCMVAFFIVGFIVVLNVIVFSLSKASGSSDPVIWQKSRNTGLLPPEGGVTFPEPMYKFLGYSNTMQGSDVDIEMLRTTGMIDEHQFRHVAKSAYHYMMLNHATCMSSAHIGLPHNLCFIRDENDNNTMKIYANLATHSTPRRSEMPYFIIDTQVTGTLIWTAKTPSCLLRLLTYDRFEPSDFEDFSSTFKFEEADCAHFCEDSLNGRKIETNRAQRKVLSCFLSVVNTHAIQTTGG